MNYQPFTPPEDEAEFLQWLFERFVPYLERHGESLNMAEVVQPMRRHAEAWLTEYQAHLTLLQTRETARKAYAEVEKAGQKAARRKLPAADSFEVILQRMHRAAKRSPGVWDHERTTLPAFAESLREGQKMLADESVLQRDPTRDRDPVMTVLRLAEQQAHAKGLPLPD